MFCLYICISEVISSFKSMRAGSQMFGLLMLFLWHLALLYVVLACHQYICKNSVGSAYGGLSESGIRVFRELCPDINTVVVSRLAGKIRNVPQVLIKL